MVDYSSNDVSDEFVQIKFQGRKYMFPKIVQEKFELGKKLDQGSFSAIFGCKELGSSKNYIIKVVSRVKVPNLSFR